MATPDVYVLNISHFLYYINTSTAISLKLKGYGIVKELEGILALLWRMGDVAHTTAN